MPKIFKCKSFGSASEKTICDWMTQNFTDKDHVVNIAYEPHTYKYVSPDYYKYLYYYTEVDDISNSEKTQ